MENSRPMTEAEKGKLKEAFRAMYRTSRKPEPETPYVYADYYGWADGDAVSCLDEVAAEQKNARQAKREGRNANSSAQEKKNQYGGRANKRAGN